MKVKFNLVKIIHPKQKARSVFEDRTANRDVLTQYVDDSTGETFDQSHYVVGDYWYTSDIINKFNDAGTSNSQTKLTNFSRNSSFNWFIK